MVKTDIVLDSLHTIDPLPRDALHLPFIADPIDVEKPPGDSPSSDPRHRNNSGEPTSMLGAIDLVQNCTMRGL